MKKTIQKNNISLNFHNFKFKKEFYNPQDNKRYYTNENVIFTCLLTIELNLERSGLKKLYNTLSTQYDNVEHAVSTTLKHKIVFEEIERMSNRNVRVSTINERAKKRNSFIPYFSPVDLDDNPQIENTMRKSKSFSFSDWSDFETLTTKPRRKELKKKKKSAFSFSSEAELFGDESSPLKIDEKIDVIEKEKEEEKEEKKDNKKEENNKKEEPFVEVEDLLENLNKKNDLDEIFDRNEIENILEDLHKLGLIVYFKKRSLSDTIISNPQWFNNVFKYIIDFGRKNIEMIFQSIYKKLCELDHYYSTSNDKLKEANNKKTKKKFSKELKWLKGKSKLEKIEDIWNNKEELKKSNLDKISFENLLIKLESMVEELIDQGEYWIFQLNELRDSSFSSISQKFIFIDEENLSNQVVRKVLEDYIEKGDEVFKEKKEFLMNILSQFDFIIPTKRMKYKMNEFRVINNVRTYVVPLLFPSYKPSSTKFFLKKISSIKHKNKIIWNDLEYENEWIVDYLLPFKPSAVWKLLFMRIRTNCVGVNESKREMMEEIYWMNGFSFYMIENDVTKAKTFVELEFIEENNKSGQILMKITINSFLFDLNLFYSSLHQTIQTFVKEWIVPEIYNKISITITKKKENNKFFNIQNNLQISTNLLLNEVIEQYHNEENIKDKFKCFNCGFSITHSDLKDNTCDKCKIFF